MPDPATLLDFPERTTTFSKRNRGDASYRLQVMAPARFMAGLWLFCGAATSGGLTFIVAETAHRFGAAPVDWKLVIAVTVLGLGAGAYMAIGHFKALDEGYLEKVEASIEERIVERGPARAPAGSTAAPTRTIRITDPNGETYQLAMEPWELAYNGDSISLTPAQCDAQIRRMAEDSEAGKAPRFVYEPGPGSEHNISGSMRARVREALVGLRYVVEKDGALYWTRPGMIALAAWEKGNG